jgi:hypothetical protein
MSLSHDCYREENSAMTAMILTACLVLLAASVGGQVVEDGTLVVELSSFLPLENCTETLIQLEVRHLFCIVKTQTSL